MVGHYGPNAGTIKMQVWEHGAQLLVRDGLLKARGWSRVPPGLQAQVQRHYYALVSEVAMYSPATQEVAIAELRAWVEDGRLETIGDTITTGGVATVSPGEAGTQAAYWLAVYDQVTERERWATRHAAACCLRSLHACAVAYWERQEAVARSASRALGPR